MPSKTEVPKSRAAPCSRAGRDLRPRPLRLRCRTSRRRLVGGCALRRRRRAAAPQSSATPLKRYLRSGGSAAPLGRPSPLLFGAPSFGLLRFAPRSPCRSAPPLRLLPAALRARLSRACAACSALVRWAARPPLAPSRPRSPPRFVSPSLRALGAAPFGFPSRRGRPSPCVSGAAAPSRGRLPPRGVAPLTRRRFGRSAPRGVGCCAAAAALGGCAPAGALRRDPRKRGAPRASKVRCLGCMSKPLRFT